MDGLNEEHITDCLCLLSGNDDDKMFYLFLSREDNLEAIVKKRE